MRRQHFFILRADSVQDYMYRAPQPPAYLFVIDTSAQSLASGMIHCLTQTVKQILSSIPGEDRTMIGFIAFDTAVHFFNLKKSLSQPQMFVLPDLNDLFIPMPSEVLVNLQDSRSLGTAGISGACLRVLTCC